MSAKSIGVDIFLVGFLLSLSACGPQFHEQIMRSMDAHVADIQTIHAMGGKLQPVISNEMQFIRAALGSDLDKLPSESVKLMDAMETEQNASALLGMYLRFWIKTTIDLVEQYAPGIIQALKAL